MENLSYESILAILVFWLALVLAFTVFVFRARRRNCRYESRVRSTSDSLVNTRRIIQIYYIGNPDSSSIMHPVGNIMSKSEDEPPSYEEVAVNKTVIDGNSSQDVNQSVRTNVVGESEVVVMVDQNPSL